MARILIIDDEVSTLRPLQILLERAGHEVRSAANGFEALRLWRESPGDLVITDIHMPEKDGIEMILEFRHFAPRVPILAMSGSGRSGQLDVLRDAALLGVVGTIAKPFAVQDMLAAVERALQAGAA